MASPYNPQRRTRPGRRAAGAVFHPQSFRAFVSLLASAVFIDAESGKQDFFQLLFFGLGKALVGSAFTVDTSE
jgi:hypothetical protein